MVEHEIVKDVDDNEYHNNIDSKILNRLSSEKKLFTFDNIPVVYVNEYIKKNNFLLKLYN